MLRIFTKLCIIFILVYAGVSLWYGRLEEKLQQKTVPPVSSVTAPPEKKTEILRKPNDYTIIVKRNIFQAVVVKTKEIKKEPVPEKLEPTKLKLSLMGTVFGIERDARAIISDDAKRQQDIYQVGDSIQGAVIKAINRGKVILVVNGKNEVLTLKDREGGGPAYQPSPSEFYKDEPSGAAAAQDEASPAIEATGAPRSVTRQRPAVRPRPIRRPSVQANPQQGIDRSGPGN